MNQFVKIAAAAAVSLVFLSGCSDPVSTVKDGTLPEFSTSMKVGDALGKYSGCVEKTAKWSKFSTDQIKSGVEFTCELKPSAELYAGIRLACEEYDVDIVGGDTSASYTGLTISITCIGEGEKGKVVYRNGARETDLICVSGDLGAAYMGLQLLEREKAVLKGGDKDLQPDFSGKEYLLERQLKPEARRDIIQKLAEEGIQPTSMMDISDGLSSELLHICTQSKVGCRVYEEHIPIDYQTAVMAEEFNMNLSTCALNGGEDYELLFTVPIADHEKVAEMEGVKLIGHITKPELGCALITRDGQEFELKAQGWNPLKEEEAEKA